MNSPTRDLLDMRLMRGVFNAAPESFELLNDCKVIDVEGHTHIFIDRGGQTLSVAHLDFVNDLTHFHEVDINGRDVVMSSRCDDRLGVYIILYLLPRLGIHSDVLLTLDEEHGKSTAKDFKPAKDYNWIYEFDRRGSGAVTYMYESKIWLDAIKKHFKIHAGSASDISKMEDLGISAMNVGTGYYDEHSHMSFFDIVEMCGQVDRFVNFYNENCDIKFPHTKKPPYVYTPPVKTLVPVSKVMQTTCSICKTDVPYYRSHDTFDNDYICRDCITTYHARKCAECTKYFMDAEGSLICEWCSQLSEEFLDIGEYMGLIGPTECKICDGDLDVNPSQFFMGICFVCENLVEECPEPTCGIWKRKGTICLCQTEVIDANDAAATNRDVQ